MCNYLVDECDTIDDGISIMCTPQDLFFVQFHTCVETVVAA